MTSWVGSGRLERGPPLRGGANSPRSGGPLSWLRLRPRQDGCRGSPEGTEQSGAVNNRGALFGRRRGLGHNRNYRPAPRRSTGPFRVPTNKLPSAAATPSQQGSEIVQVNGRLSVRGGEGCGIFVSGADADGLQEAAGQRPLNVGSPWQEGPTRASRSEDGGPGCPRF